MKRNLSLALAALLGCAHSSSPAPEAKPAQAEAKPAEAKSAEAPQADAKPSGLDPSVKPGDDFFEYANGGWEKSAEIPADRASWGTGEELAELTAKRVRELIEEVSQAPKEPIAKQVGDFYATFLDEAAVEAKGLAPLAPELQRIAAIADKKQLARALGETLRADVDVLNATEMHTANLFGLWVAQDLGDPQRYTSFILQGGLGMPDRDYYVDPAPRMEEIRKQYVAHIGNVLKLAHLSGDARKIFELELRIAQVHASRTDSEDVEKGNNRWQRKDLDARAPGLDWSEYFRGAGFEPAQLTVWQPRALTGISALVRELPLETWKEWLAFHAVENGSPELPRAFVDERFAFYGKALSGTPMLRERWKRALSATDEALGEAVGRLYVERYFPPSEKARAEEMVKHELAAFARRIDALAWMAPETKRQAKAKLLALKVGVGYPDKWRDYSGLEVVRGDAYGNARRAELFEYQRNLKKLGQPVDRGEWVMNAHLVNAVNLPAMNALNFPAAILQPPYFDPRRKEVMDYGAAGAIIGHEISHSFDNQGALFDAEGRVHNWWTPADFAHFKQSGAALIAQYDAYLPFPDLHLRGEQTLAENIADVAGLSAAYDAYRAADPGANKESDQLFFLSFAQSWREKMREQALRQRVVVDGHAPAHFRGETVRNLDAWYPAFDIQPSDKLYLDPAARVHVW